MAFSKEEGGEGATKRASKVTFSADVTAKAVASRSKEPLDAPAIAKCRELLRTVLAVTPEDEEDAGKAAANADACEEAALEGAGPELWKYPDAPEDEAGGGAAAAPGEGRQPLLEARADPLGGALLLSHAWDEPENWSKYFSAQTFAEAKQIQVASGLRVAAQQRQLARAGASPRVWVDCASLPDPIEQADHPFEKVEFGPFVLPVRELKSLVAIPEEATGGYTVLRLPDGHVFEGTMQIRTFDAAGRPSKDADARQVQWEIAPGWYHVRSARVVPEDMLSPEAAAEKEEFSPALEHLRPWCTRLGLRDEVWVELTLGTLRSECLLLANQMMSLHSGMVAVVAWNYFDRLWPLCEWAFFCKRCGPERVQLAADAFGRPALIEFHRALRRLSVDRATCRDRRDRPLLLGMLEREFACEARDVTQCYRKPAPGVLTAAVCERVVNFAPVERYIRATAIAAFAREAALAASRSAGRDDEAGWVELSDTLGLAELHGALKKCKPWDWHESAKRRVRGGGSAAAGTPAAEADGGAAESAGGGEGEGEEGDAEAARCEAEEAAYEEQVEAWWRDLVLPVLEAERRRATRR